jgi:two-component system chemotaxis response regulator CheB
MARVRVLIVDDSVVVRKVLTDALSADPDLEVVGSAANGSIALQKIPQLNPDVVILDVEMPEMDGVETVRRIRLGWPNLAVIMCSSLTERGADTSLRALSNGASDYVTKPSQLGTRDPNALLSFKTELAAKVKALTAATHPPTRKPSTAVSVAKQSSPAAPRAPRSKAPVSVLAIGCSTGGPNALATLFQGIPRDIAIPILITQHMPPLFTKLLADRLAASSGLPVSEARSGDIVEPGKVFIAPGDYHMTIVREGVRTKIVLNQDPPENSCRPAVDVMFRSIANVYGSGVLATVLTGMGQDGARGAQHIFDAGGTIIVQDAASCVVPSMPGAVVSAGLAEAEYPIDRLAQELMFRIRRHLTAGAFSNSSRRLEV